MSKLALVGMEFEVDEIVYSGNGIAVYVLDGDLTIDDGCDSETMTDTPDNRAKLIEQAKAMQISVEYKSGESRQDCRPIDYMLAASEGTELYAEADIDETDERGTFDELKAAILQQAIECGIAPDRLVFDE
jgi:hypothetical protein